MSDETVRAALRSDARLVAVEAPGGSGKTTQGASYARDVAASLENGRVLVLTHTHAACSIFHARTRGVGTRIEIRTIDSLISQITTAYHSGLDLPKDTALWARRNNEGYDQLAVKAAALLEQHPAVAASLTYRYPIVICDEHQDSSGDRHAAIMALYRAGSRLRIFADPMQAVFPPKRYPNGYPPLDWATFTNEADAFERLDTPHRWKKSCPALGHWVLAARARLQEGGKLDLRSGLPDGLSVVFADNSAYGNLEYRPAATHRKPIDAFERSGNSLLILSRFNETTISLRPTFGRRIPIWEGHNRPSLERLVDALTDCRGDSTAVARAVVTFVRATTVGFTAAEFANTFQQDVADGCTRTRRGRPAKLQQLARLVVNEPNHVGACKVLSRLAELHTTDADFRSVDLDCVREFYEAARLGLFETPEAGFAEITHRRSYSRPAPPAKAISTIHKAKGLECQDVIVMPCDGQSFPDNQISRCLLYVAMSRAANRLMLVIPRNNPSPLLVI